MNTQVPGRDSNGHEICPAKSLPQHKRIVPMSIPAESTVGLLLGGGLDRAILLGPLLERNCRVQPFFVCSHLVGEITKFAAAQRLLATMASPRLAEVVVLDIPIHTPRLAKAAGTCYQPKAPTNVQCTAATWMNNS